MDMDLKIDWNFILSCLGIVGAIFVYFAHGRKLRKQEAKLNEIQLAKETQPDVIVELDRERKCISVYNRSPVCANDVDVKVLPDICNMRSEFPFPMNMEAGQKVTISVQLGLSAPEKVGVELSWGAKSNRGRVTRSYVLPTRS